MRRTWLALALAIAIATVLTATAAAVAMTTVQTNPARGSPSTQFRLTFTSPERTGKFGSLLRRQVVSATGPVRRGGCVALVSVVLPPTRPGHRVHLTLNPKQLGGVWCVGRYSGRIADSESVICRPRRACPDLVVAPRTIATFSFRVQPAKQPAGRH